MKRCTGCCNITEIMLEVMLTLWEKEKILVTSIFLFSQTYFTHFECENILFEPHIILFKTIPDKTDFLQDRKHCGLRKNAG